MIEKIIQLLTSIGVLKGGENVVIDEHTVLERDHASLVYGRRASIGEVVSKKNLLSINSFKGDFILIVEVHIDDRVSLVFCDPDINEFITMINV